MRARIARSTAHLSEALKAAATLLVVLGAIALTLRILNLVPPALAPDSERAYDTVDEARRATRVPVHMPAYYPEYLRWPPMEVRGWAQPAPRVSITVTLRETGRPAIWLEQWLPPPSEPPSDLPNTAYVVARDTASLRDDAVAELVTYRNLGSQLFHRLTWEADGLWISMTGALPRDELLRIARSMFPPPSF